MSRLFRAVVWSMSSLVGACATQLSTLRDDPQGDSTAVSRDVEQTGVATEDAPDPEVSRRDDANEETRSDLLAPDVADGSAEDATVDAPADDGRCVGAPGSLGERSATPFGASAPTSMCEYSGMVLLIANIAAADGFTPQWAGLQVLEDTFAAEGFHVLGFMSDDFGQQGGTPQQIRGATESYGVTFPLFSVDHVIDTDGAGPLGPQPVFEWLLAQPSPGPASGLPPTWNHHKYLISRDGVLLSHWDSAVYPGDDPNNPSDSFDTNAIVMAIKNALAAPRP